MYLSGLENLPSCSVFHCKPSTHPVECFIVFLMQLEPHYPDTFKYWWVVSSIWLADTFIFVMRGLCGPNVLLVYLNSKSLVPLHLGSMSNCPICWMGISLDFLIHYCWNNFSTLCTYISPFKMHQLHYVVWLNIWCTVLELDRKLLYCPFYFILCYEYFLSNYKYLIVMSIL